MKNGKSNVTQDDEKQIALRWRNHNEKFLIHVKITYSYLNREKKMKMGDFGSKIGPKPSPQ